ncbi:MAG TPA: hypothetical protein VL485_31175, partial [Ktedonobacteraceae bacterium]|nr:hypothetical protein [Ktedonobacteraceae bacterium]
DHRRPLAKDDSSRKTPQVGTGLYAGPRPPPAILSAMGTGYRLIYVTWPLVCDWGRSPPTTSATGDDHLPPCRCPGRRQAATLQGGIDGYRVQTSRHVTYIGGFPFFP